MPCEVPSLAFRELPSHPVASPEGVQKIYFLDTGIMYVRGTGAPQLFLASQGVTLLAMTLLAEETAGEMLTTLGFSAFVQTLLNDADAATFRLSIGAAESGANGDITSFQSPIVFNDTATFNAAVTLAVELFDSLNSPGTSGQFLISTTTATEWGSTIPSLNVTVSATIQDLQVPGTINTAAINASGVISASTGFTVGTVPTITAGSGVPGGVAQDGSIYLRFGAPNGSLYVRQNGVWTLK